MRENRSFRESGRSARELNVNWIVRREAFACGIYLLDRLRDPQQILVVQHTRHPFAAKLDDVAQVRETLQIQLVAVLLVQFGRERPQDLYIIAGLEARRDDENFGTRLIESEF